MDYKEKATILRVCSSKKGERCSRCPAFGQGNQNCMRNAMKDGATAITDLLARAEAAEAENAALRKMQPIQLDDTGAQALTLAAEVSELRKKLEAYEATGLEPEDLKKPFDEEVLLTMTARMMGITPDRLRELVEADHDGRCFITGRPYPVTGKAADVAPVVRCRECKHWKPGDFMAGDDIDHMYRGGGCPIRRFAVYENDFCSEGERRESNENQT